MRHLFAVMLIFSACGCACAAYSRTDIFPLQAVDILTTNWIAAVKEALPASQPEHLSFQAATNLLCQESRRGNIAAQGLWGFIVLIQNRSPEEMTTGLQLLRNSAGKGYVPAMLNLGFLLAGGQYVQRDYSEAFHWFAEAADKNDPDGLLQLGGCYHYGLGTNRDLVKASECYRRAAVMTNYVAMKSLGYLLMNGLGVPKDIAAARHWFMRAAREGNNRRAIYNLGVLCFSPEFSATNSMAEGFHWFKQSAEMGDALASLQLATCYYRGWGVETNVEAYRYWRLRAATLGATAAQYLMGAACRTGDGVPKDLESSLAWYRKAAAKNYPPALYDLALHYRADTNNQLSRLMAEAYMLQAAQGGHREAQFQCAMSCFRGDVRRSDFEAGKQWLATSAENGWARAEFCLSQLYYNGLPPGPGCPPYPKDMFLAIKWLRRAAEHQDLQAQSTLAVMLIQGKNVETNKEEAEQLLRHAAGHGYAPAQNDLGFAIQSGDTAKIDLVEAAMWCRLAQSQATGSNVLRQAGLNLSNVWSRLNPNQRIEVDTRVKDFRALPVTDPDPMIKDSEWNPAYQPEDGQFGH